jgi:putative lipoprotein
MPLPVFRALRQIAGLAWTGAVIALLAGCSGRETDATVDAGLASVAGTLSFPELVTLGDDAVVEVELADVSVTDGPAVVVSTQRIRKPGQFPVHFRLDYAPDRIDPTHRYTVQARIREGDQLAYATDSAFPVITAGNPRSLDVPVVAIGSGDPAPAISALAQEKPLQGTLASGGVNSTYSATFRNGSIASIQEDRDAGTLGKSGAEYQFKDGRLLRYVELGTRKGAAGPEQVEFDFAFDDTGELLAARKTVNDTAMKPDLDEINAARNRADLLRNHALALRSSREHGH